MRGAHNMKTILAIAGGATAALLLQGCAVLGGQERTTAAAQPEPAASARYAASGGPVGLVRCKKARIGDQSCWRRGDIHILYPTDDAAETDAALVAYDAAVPASVRARK